MAVASPQPERRGILTFRTIFGGTSMPDAYRKEVERIKASVGESRLARDVNFSVLATMSIKTLSTMTIKRLPRESSTKASGKSERASLPKSLLVVTYISALPDPEGIVELLESLRPLAPGCFDRFEIVSTSGKELRGKYDPVKLAERVRSVWTGRVLFLSAHSKFGEDDGYEPRRMISIAPRFLEEDAPYASLCLYVPVSEVEDTVSFSQSVLEAMCRHADVRYGFAVSQPSMNADFHYGDITAVYVDRRPPGYRVVEELDERLMKQGASAFEPLIAGRQVRSVYPVNLVSTAMAEKIVTVLPSNGEQFTPLASNGNMHLWQVPDATKRRAIYTALKREGMTLESDWFDVEQYKPRFAIIREVV